MDRPLTEEQRSVIDRVLEGHNVRVRAVPGAGKTHTLNPLVPRVENIGRRVLQITYYPPQDGVARKTRSGPRSRPLQTALIPLICGDVTRSSSTSGDSPTEDDSLRRMLDLPPPRKRIPTCLRAHCIAVDETQDVCVTSTRGCCVGMRRHANARSRWCSWDRRNRTSTSAFVETNGPTFVTFWKTMHLHRCSRIRNGASVR